MRNKPQTDPGLLLMNKRSTKSDIIDTYYEEPSFEDSSSISDNDDIYYEDSDDEGVKQRKEETKTENADYTLKAGTIITFIPHSIFIYPNPVTAIITVVKENCDIDPYPLIVEPRELVSRTTSIKAEGKQFPFLLKNIKMKPGSIQRKKKAIQKNLTTDQHYEQIC